MTELLVDDRAPLGDIKPYTQIARLDPLRYCDLGSSYPIADVAIATGMSETFIRKVCGKKVSLSPQDVLVLLEQDAYAETIVPRSRVIEYLEGRLNRVEARTADITEEVTLTKAHALDYIGSLPAASVTTVVTSTPYWAMRLYKDPFVATWADGEAAAFGHEQTPEGFMRHTTEILAALWDVLTPDGSIWWNLMDTYNTRTQVRGNAAEALRAMQGRDRRSWGDHEVRRYSHGHSFLKDGEQCLIPTRVAERASRIGFFVKSVITWAKTSTLPEPQESRVSRNLEYVLHLSKTRAPKFNKDAYRSLPATLGGRNAPLEADRLSDVWTLATSSGRDGHGAQFPLALPARCIALSTDPGDIVLDPFVGAGNTGVAALALGRRFLGVDVTEEYLQVARNRISGAQRPLGNGFSGGK